MPVTVRVLLIDDNLPDRVRYRRMLQRAGDSNFDIVEAEDGTRGLQAIAGKGPFDCVVLDQDLPDMQGLDVLDDIRALANQPPVVMLTGEEDAAISIDALRRGASDYLMKRRIDEDRLQRAIVGAIERDKLSRQLRENELRLARFYRLANQTEDALFIVEAASARITECNEAARNRLNLVPGSTSNATQPAAFASPELWRDFCRRAQSEGSARYEWHFLQADGSAAIIEILARCIEEDGTPYIVAVGRDISLRKQREQDLIDRSLRDGLTGVWNRRAFDERLAEYWRNAARNRRPLAVVMIDVDHFKFYNDTLGHPAGDECLRQVALALRSGVLRGSSMVARYGGEEFVAVLEDTDLVAARACAERLRLVVQSLAIPHPRSSISNTVTVSIGVVSGHAEPDLTPKMLIDAADAALYRAKRAGRNRVAAHGDTEGAAA